MFEQKAGYFRETENDVVMEKVDKERNIIGFLCFYLKVECIEKQTTAVFHS
ncbi:MAG TPA: DUF2283 domain-containing protein [Candidatus Kapabacteria bacterium]|nr:DUF2283 domain-containing protein [Candidatus Kapabacteria bacterium]